MNNDLQHHEFSYNIGLNIDTQSFVPNEYDKKGLYFCEESYCYLYWTKYGEKIAIIEIPDDSRVYVDPNKFKADKLIIVRIIDFKDMDDGFWLNIFQTDVWAFRYIKNRTTAICLSAIERNKWMIRYLEYPSDQTEAVHKIIVQRDGLALKYILNQTEEVCRLAVQQNGFALQYVRHQTKEICELATKRNRSAVYYVRHPTEKDMTITDVILIDQFLNGKHKPHYESTYRSYTHIDDSE